jgi:hypothetical protein
MRDSHKILIGLEKCREERRVDVYLGKNNFFK